MGYPPVNVVKEVAHVTCTCFCYKHLKSFSLGHYVSPTFSRLLLLTPEAPVAHGSSYLSLVYLFVVLSWAFFQKVLSKARGWSSKAQPF